MDGRRDGGQDDFRDFSVGNMAKKKDDGRKVVADNRKARYSYAIESTLEAGLMLMGSEVKSLRAGKATIAESYAHAKDGEIFLVNSYIPEYKMANRFNHEPRRARKVLVHKREAAKLAAAIQREGMTLVPLRVYFNPKGIAKIELGIAKGKKLHDKRETEKKRDWQRDKARLMRDKG
jgi:SsrA-binding protein